MGRDRRSPSGARAGVRASRRRPRRLVEAGVEPANCEAELIYSQRPLATWILHRIGRVTKPAESVLFKPQIGLRPGGGPPEDTVGIGVSFALPLWNWNRGEIKSAQATVEKNSLAVAKAKAQAVADVANAQSEFSEASERLARYQKQILPKSQKVRESVAFAYEKGGASLVDLLEAERADNDARLATAQAMADTASASADLQAATEATDLTNVRP